MKSRLELLATSDGDRVVLRAPALGIWCDAPRLGSPLGGGSGAGSLIRLQRHTRLLLPPRVAGIVEGELPQDRMTPVEFGQELFRLRPLGGVVDSTAAQRDPALADGGEGEQLAEGTFAVRAPTDGVFYRRPAPDAAAFVEPGSSIEEGHPIGMVEVMKTFHQIVYGGAELPARATVVELRAEDGALVRAGQVLAIVR